MKKIILLVEDELEVARAMETILEDEGFEVMTCGDGLEAQSFLVETIPDLIISDVMMPKCGGYELLKFIKNETRLKKVPFILMSAVEPKKELSKSQTYLRKPFNLDDLLRLIDEALN